MDFRLFLQSRTDEQLDTIAASYNLEFENDTDKETKINLILEKVTEKIEEQIQN